MNILDQRKGNKLEIFRRPREAKDCGIENMDLARMKAHEMVHNSNGLLYRYGNKSRRKVEQALVLLAILLMPLTCDGEEKIIRVDPLGMKPCLHALKC